jgi:hypothetical protein
MSFDLPHLVTCWRPGCAALTPPVFMVAAARAVVVRVMRMHGGMDRC